MLSIVPTSRECDSLFMFRVPSGTLAYEVLPHKMSAAMLFWQPAGKNWGDYLISSDFQFPPLQD